jgi:hypothetical protein
MVEDTATADPVRAQAQGASATVDRSDSSPSASDVSLHMSRELRRWGVSLIVLGVLHFALAGFLEPTWGIVLAVLGILNLVIQRRGMFIANGVALGVVGLMNIFSGGVGGWTFFGILQLYWGFREITKYGRYRQCT